MSAASPLAATAVAQLSTDAVTAQRVSDALTESFDAAAMAVSAFEQPDGRWSLAVHFRERPDEAEVRAVIASAAGTAAARALTFETLAPADWVRKSLDGLTPVEAGRFVVHGAHHRAHVEPNRIGIQIEAGLAFGTGHHGTTRGCLLALARIAKGMRGKPQRSRAAPLSTRSRRSKALVLDIGTGTGVLAIAAAKALRAPVLASDIDARAIGIARDNARINGVGPRVGTIRAAGLGASRFRERAPFRLIFANILLDPLRELATPMARLVAPNGYVVLSGLLAGQGRAALASYRARGFVLAGRIPLEGWTTLMLVQPRRARRTGGSG